MNTVRVSWLQDSIHKVLYFDVDGQFTVEDYEQAVDVAWDLLDQYKEKQPVYVVANVTQLRSIPPNTIMTMLKMYQSTHQSFSGLTIFLGAPRFVRYLTTRFAPVFRTSRFDFADSLDDVDDVIINFETAKSGRKSV